MKNDTDKSGTIHSITHTASIASIALALALSSAAQAKPYHNSDIANVVHVEPVYKTVEHRIPKESCWTESVRIEPSSNSHRSSGTPTLIGGIIGGVIGNEVGHGRSNKKIGAVVGSILGMSIANDIQKRNNHSSRHHTSHQQARYENLERCEISHHIETEQVLQGYNVDYAYHGKTYSTFMNEHPGKKLRVAVEVRPLGR